ncbi:TetR/AcrR family transcriptional regulator [Pedobacter heparinus]|uniref:TetR/AcrR family transcriptional regulator n=1 Tax=Pedobacter heparinus TaxID=984 RepID=UPI00292E1FA2|nr:TetR/AcrR family transcriptional regulator [Pedobacter heparinus]
MSKKKPDADNSTEEKIKAAANVVFIKKGFAGTRTRDIAEEAGINLALLNYYFRSKEKLFDIVMMENIQQFLAGMRGVLNDETLSLTAKITAIAENYTNMLKIQPNMPLFILGEIKANPEKLVTNMKVKEIMISSHFYQQLKAALNDKVNPLHFLINIISLAVFPFVASPMLKVIGELKDADFDKMVEERKKMIPVWVDAMLKTH